MSLSNQLESGAYIYLHSNENKHKMETSLLCCSLSVYNLELFSIEKMSFNLLGLFGFLEIQFIMGRWHSSRPYASVCSVLSWILSVHCSFKKFLLMILMCSQG